MVHVESTSSFGLTDKLYGDYCYSVMMILPNLIFWFKFDILISGLTACVVKPIRAKY